MNGRSVVLNINVWFVSAMMVSKKSFPCQAIESRRHPKQSRRLSAILSSLLSVYVFSSFGTFDIFPSWYWDMLMLESLL
jgi:hypothetical protein